MKRTAQTFGQNRDAFTQPFTVPNGDVTVPEMDILYA